jgi:hypothetical protein
VKIDKTLPVSREDYDRMADQRDAFRAALVTAETYFEGVLDTDVDHVEPAEDLDRIAMLAQAGLDVVKKALKGA